MVWARRTRITLLVTLLLLAAAIWGFAFVAQRVGMRHVEPFVAVRDETFLANIHPDVVEAILYLVSQQYETGQALPVTGGQVMLS